MKLSLVFLLFLLLEEPVVVIAQTIYRTSDGTTFKDKYDAQRHEAKIAARAEEKAKEEKEKEDKARREGRLLKPGEKVPNYDDFVFTTEQKLNYNKVISAAKKKKIKGLEFEPEGSFNLNVTHNNAGLDVYPSDLFHERVLSTWSYNNFRYQIHFSFDESALKDFGVGYGFSTRPSDKHACDEYLFFAFIIMNDGRFLFQKSANKNRYKTNGSFEKLKKDVPGFFDTSSYTTINYEKLNLSANNISLIIQQIKGDFQILINSTVVYHSNDDGFDCPVFSGETPYNIFLNKGKVKFKTGRELYIDKTNL